MTTTDIGTIHRELVIEAPRELVYDFLTDPAKIVRWMGRDADIDARPGGQIRVDYNGFDVMRGEFVELSPPERVVYTFGWATLLADHEPKPGASTVEFTLEPHSGGTLLRMVHSGLTELTAPSHSEGWDMFLARLRDASSGREVEALVPPLSDAEELAARLNAVLVDALELVENSAEPGWLSAVPGDGRSAGVVAHHVTGHLGLVGMAEAILAGAHDPGPTLDDINANNEAHATEFAEVTSGAVAAALQEQGPAVVEKVKALSDADLAVTRQMAFAAGSEVSVGDLLRGPLLEHIEAHLAGVREVLLRA